MVLSVHSNPGLPSPPHLPMRPRACVHSAACFLPPSTLAPECPKFLVQQPPHPLAVAGSRLLQPRKSRQPFSYMKLTFSTVICHIPPLSQAPSAVRTDCHHGCHHCRPGPSPTHVLCPPDLTTDGVAAERGGQTLAALPVPVTTGCRLLSSSPTPGTPDASWSPGAHGGSGETGLLSSNHSSTCRPAQVSQRGHQRPLV